MAVGDTPYTLGPVRGLRWPDEGEPPDCDLFLVSRVASHYLAFVSGLFNPPQYNAQIYLASSFDGLRWDRLPDNPPVSPPRISRPVRPRPGGGESPTSSIEPTCTTCSIAARPAPRRRPTTSTPLAWHSVRRHRFVSQMAGDEGGYLLTRLVRVTHPHLRVNLTLPTTVGARTDFQAELLAPDERGVAHPVPGYTFDDCVTPGHRRPRCPRPLARAR